MANENPEIRIPEDLLKITGLRYVIVAPYRKAPFERGWQDSANYDATDPKLLKYLKSGYNYGILCGVKTGDSFVVVIDADDRIVVDIVRDKLPETLSWRTQTEGHMAFMYMSDHAMKTRPIYNMSVTEKRGFMNIGHIRGSGSIEIGPGCRGENGNYELDHVGPPASVKAEYVEGIFSPFFSRKK